MMHLEELGVAEMSLQEMELVDGGGRDGWYWIGYGAGVLAREVADYYSGAWDALTS